MVNILLDNDLIKKVLEAGHYQTPQEAVVSILSDYITTHESAKSRTDCLYMDVDMADGEIDSLFERDRDLGKF
jgi:hypothetical protein